MVKHFDAHSWAWNDNPFVGTRELNGLKILMMLLSNWDNKDVRDVSRGSNTAIFEYRTAKGGREARYLIIDWGAALGAWGGNVIQRGRWDAEAFAAQNEQLITGVKDGPNGQMWRGATPASGPRTPWPTSRPRTSDGSTSTLGRSATSRSPPRSGPAAATTRKSLTSPRRSARGSICWDERQVARNRLE